MTLDQVRLAGLPTLSRERALSRELGPVGLVRFLQQYEVGFGDYTTERHDWLGDPSVQDIYQEIKQNRDTPAQ
jgi:hypothetical protein